MRTVRFVLILMLIVALTLLLNRNNPNNMSKAPGLDAALSLLYHGKQASPKYYSLLQLELKRAADAYEYSFISDGVEAIQQLRLQRLKARAAAQELLDSLPRGSGLIESKIRDGKALMTARLCAWVDDVKVRCGLPSSTLDSAYIWNRYYELE